MKTQFFTRNLYIGLLMALVLAFNVPDTADALTFGTSRSGDLQTALPNQQNGFRIRFSVSLGSNSTRITDTDGNLVSEGGTRIDSSGYAVFEASNEREYRLSAAANNLTSTYVRNTDGTYSKASGTLYVDSGGNVVDGSGASVYIQAGTDPDFTYTRARANPDPKLSDSQRYHYNEEAIEISVSNAYITQIGRYTFTDTTKTTHTLDEHGTDAGKNRLSSSVEVTFNAATANVVQITITDTTPATDAPPNGRAAPLYFTVYVVQQQSAVQNTGTTYMTGRDGVEYGYDTEDPQVSGYFDFAAQNAPVNYSVEGSGRVYVSVSPDRRTNPTNTLWTSSEAPVYLDVNRGTSKVTAWISGNPGKTVVYIFSGQNPSQYPRMEITQGNPQTGAIDARLEDSLVVRVTDGNGRALSGVAVEFATLATSVGSDQAFIPVPGTIVYSSGNTLTSELKDANAIPLVDNTQHTKIATATRPNPGKDIFVQTDSTGVAQVYYRLGDALGDYQVTASLEGSPLSLSQTFDAIAVDASRSASLVVVSGTPQTSDPETHDVKDPLVVRVRRPGGYRISDVTIRFTALTGVLEADLGTTYAIDDNGDRVGPLSGQEIYVSTNAHGEAGVVYNAGQIAGAKTVTARVDDEEKTTQYDFQIRQVEFHIDGASAPPQQQQQPQQQPTPTTFSVTSSISGAPGSTQSLRVTAPANDVVQIGGFNDTFSAAGGSASPALFTGSNTSTLTLPTAAGTYSLSVFAGATAAPRTVTVTVTTPQAQTQTGGSLRVDVPFSGAPGSQQVATVTATDSNGNLAPGIVVTFSVTSGGGTLSPATVTTGTNGTATSTLTRGSTPGNIYFVTASATGYTENRTRINITGETDATPPGTTPTAGAPDALDIYDGEDQSGPLNEALADPFVVEVLDANGNPVENVRVRFRVTEGNGRLSPRTPRTDEDGFAETMFTPTSGGDITVTATVAGIDDEITFTVTAGEPPAALVNVSGDAQRGTPDTPLAAPFVVEVQDAAGEPTPGIRVAFSVTAGGGSLSETSAVTGENGRAQTKLTLGPQRGVNTVQATVSGVDPITFSTRIDPEILVPAANRPVMYWIDSGRLYRLAGEKAEPIAENVNAVAIGNGSLYWTAQTGESAGTINRSNLDGTGATPIATIKSVPIGIAVDTVNSHLYWANSRGRIQRATLNGTGIQNVLQNRSDPRHIVLSSDTIYWTEGGNSIRRVNKTGQKTVKDVAVGLSNLGGLAIGAGNVYWTEQTGPASGTINGAELDGTQFATLATLQSAPMGIAVDTAGSQLYWTNARGRVQRANLNGTSIRNVVEGLISASHLVIGGANTETPGAKPTPQPKSKAAASDYDVNGDGNVDNADASLVAAAMGTSEAKYDVDGNGTVDFLDLLLVFDNRDAAAASAPTVIGMQLTAVQRDRIQAQIDLLIATNDRSPVAMRTLVYLQQLLATARPEKTQLLANYPNPFNPETWIPYQLARDTPVKITIYTPQGVVVRTLELGHQSAGYYTGRDRAAYWNGRNAQGEPVASGIYFYQFETDDISALRKMVILK